MGTVMRGAESGPGVDQMVPGEPSLSRVDGLAHSAHTVYPTRSSDPPHVTQRALHQVPLPRRLSPYLANDSPDCR